ncbi:MAG: hypothetical protein GXP45_02960, partial [bacterium]|nr:hypothetical protein [bacterium]
MVEKNVEAQYIKIGIYEELINNTLKEILDENKKIKFMGEPYDIHEEEK